MNTDLVAYYKDRAKEYEKIYTKPERQADLESATKILQTIFKHRQVLEIACGTGYWTERIAATANTIFATDINEAVVDIAKQKKLSSEKVSFGIADVYNFQDNNTFESLFCGFLWSHILLQDLDIFLSIIDNLVIPGGTVVFMDNNFVEGSNLPITKKDEQGKTFQTRTLENDTAHLVLKNFPTEIFIRQKFKAIAGEFTFINLTYFWIVCYTTKKNTSNV